MKNPKDMIMIGLIAIFLLFGAVTAGTGIGAVSRVGSVLSMIWDSLTDPSQDEIIWGEQVSARELLELMDKHQFSIDPAEEKKLMLAPGNFRYLLKKIVAHEKSGIETREIQIQGFHEYIETVESTSTDEAGNEVTDTEEVDREEYVYQTITVSNQEIEGMHHIDWRMLYIYALLQALGSRNDGTGEIEATEESSTGSFLIRKVHIDEVMDKLSMKYDYAFDVMRSAANSYTYEQCQLLPHRKEQTGDPDSSVGQYTYFYPKSLLNSGSSGISTLAHTQEEGRVTGTEELFSIVNFEALGNSVSPYYSYQYLTSLWEKIPGGKKLKELYDWYHLQAEAGNAVMQSSIYLIDPGSYDIAEGGRYTFEGTFLPGLGSGQSFRGSVGEAAMKLALSRLTWQYSQARRHETGFWDCSSMVSRVYREIGVEIPVYSTTDSLLRMAENKGQTIQEQDLQPGDIIFFQTMSGSLRGNYKGVGHVVMYAGNGMIIHAASEKSGTVHQPLSQYYNYPGGVISYARPYLNVASSYVPSGVTGNTQASSFKTMSNQQIAEWVLEIAKEDYDNTGILASITAAQMILESGYLKSKLSVEANNCFGIKASVSANVWANSTWDGISIHIVQTKEQNSSGAEYTTTASFRQYASVEDSVSDHSAYLLGAKNGGKPRYGGLVLTKNYRTAAEIIKNGGYATDTKYVDKLCSVIEKYNLNRYD